jgi:hypothetical protein
MIKWIIIIAVVIIAIIVIAAIVDGNTEPSTPTKRYTPPTPSPQRQVAAQRAAAQMNNQQMRNAGTEAVQIRRVVHQRNLSINTGALNTAQDKIIRLCSHADRIRTDVQRYCNNPAYLQQLYRTGVGISNEAYQLRVEIKAMQDSLYKLSRSNSALRPLFEQVKAFCNSVYADEVELNNRNRILRNYIGNNFGSRERRWNEEIEARARARRANA